MARRSRDVIDERDYLDVRVRERERDVDRDPLARYFQEDRRSDAGALVLRQREVETIERPRQRQRSPSPLRYREVIRERSPSPLPPPREREVVDRVEIRDRVYDREWERDRNREPSRGPPQERVVTRIVERERERSPTPPPEREHERIRIVERSRVPSPSPSPPPQEQRQLIRGPVVEREVITHYTDVDHGVVYAPRAPPRPEPRRERERERDTEIDIYSSRNRTEVDIHDERRRSRSRSRLRAPPARSSEKEVIVRSDRHHLEVDIDERRPRRSRSAQPPVRQERRSAVDDEARYIERRIDGRGRMGEAYNGATKDWTIIDVPPGTEHVRMDGVGGGSADITWQRYNGVRRTRFIPEREGEVAAAPRHRTKEPPRERERSSHGEHINVQIIDQKSHHGHSREREIEVEADQRLVLMPSTRAELMPAARSDMWTEITKDLVSREAIDYLGYDYQETEYFYYILQYLRYEDVQELVQLSDRIRRQRRKEQYSEVDIDIDVKHKHSRRRSHSHHRPRRDDDLVYEHELVVDHLHPGYYR